ncbi:MAG TPA: TonB-dependent receptor, partial [Chthoniobacterales bacterium]|nr:TonB-dependent receptor [Chthoniobacterales bacterium]
MIQRSGLSRIRISAVIALILLMGFIGNPAYTQTLGSLVGTVRDQSGGVVSGAKVVAIQRETGIAYQQSTNSAGEYVFNHLPIGTWTLTFDAPSFRELRVDGIQTHTASIFRQDATLALASVAVKVEVESSTPLVKSETAEIGQLVEARQITELPLNGRDVYSLLTLSGGAETNVSETSRFTDLERPTVAGGRAGYTVFRIEGVDVNSQNLPSASITPGVDAVQEFRLTAQLAPASESSTSTVNVAIRAGTNEFHGVAYDFFRNNALDAHPFFEHDIVTPSFHTVPDQLRYNQFGGSLGGPIRKDRTFFFANVQLTRIRTVSQITGTFPTAQMLQGDFSGVNPLSGSAMLNFGPLIDPQTLQAFPGNRIPADRFSAFAAKFLPMAFLPANCLACQAQGLGFNFVGEAPAQTNTDQYLGRVDHHFSDKDTVFGTLQVEPTTGVRDASPIAISVVDADSRAYFAGIDETHSFTPSLVNELRLGYTRLRASLQQAKDAQGAFTFQNTPTSLPSLYPTVVVAGYPERFGNGEISDRNFSLEDSWDLTNNVSWVHGQQEVKFGFEAIRSHFWNSVNLNAFFVYADGLPGVFGYSGSGFADFLLGTPYEALTYQGTGKAPMVERSVYAGFVQDSWKLTRSLTVNAGIRYEFPQRWHDENTSLNRLGTLDTSAASEAMGGRFLLGGSANYYVPGQGVVQGSGAPLVRGSLVDPAWHDFQPRAGLAWRPFHDNKTAIRAGAGIYFAIQDANSLAFEMLSPPFQYEDLFVNTPPAVPLGQPLHDAQFWPASAPMGVATEGNDPRNRDPHLYEWTASIEHQIGNSTLLSVEYLGNHGVKNPLTILVNTPGLPNAAELAVLEAFPVLDNAL